MTSLADSPVTQAPRVSVLTVTYQSALTIPAFLDSLLPQLVEVDGELIIVDNFSRDHSAELIQAAAATESRIRVILNPRNLGFAMGCNQALQAARGRDVFLLNPDTELRPGVLQGLLDALNTEGVAAIAPQLRFPDGRIQHSCRRFPTHWNLLTSILGLAALFPDSRWANGWKMGDFDHATPRDVEQPAAAALLVQGNLYRELGGLDPEYPMFFNDVDLCQRILQRGYRIRFDPHFQIVHAGGASIDHHRLRMAISSQLSFFRYFTRTYTRLIWQIPNLLIGLLLYLTLIPRILLALIPRRKNRSSL